MGKGEKYDKMVDNPSEDRLGLFKNYFQIFSKVRERIRELDAKVVIDLACGTGNLCGELSEEVLVKGLDRNEEMLGRAKVKFPSAEFKVGNILEHSYEYMSADIVTTSFILHSLSDEEQLVALKIMGSYLKSNGKIIIVDYMFKDKEQRDLNRKGFLQRGEGMLWDFIDNKNFINIENFTKKAEALGYTVEYKHMNNFTWIIEMCIN